MLYESEKKVLEIIWKQDGIAAKEIAKLLEPAGWSKSTTYTIISRCMEKGLVRREGKYNCYSMISREKAQQESIRETLDSFFDNSAVSFFAAFTETRNLSEEEKQELREMIDRLK